MVANDENDSLASISDRGHIEVNVRPSRLPISESVAAQKKKGGPHAPWRKILPQAEKTADDDDTSEPPTVFSDKKISNEPLSQIIAAHGGPVVKEPALTHLQRKPGHVPVSTLFHHGYYRPRLNDDDDDDLDMVARKKRKNAPKVERGKSIVYDTIFWDKGEFSFPYRTFRPKIQVANKVAPGSMPQGVIADRLHRIYRKLDISAGLSQLGVEYTDLLPPPNYGEHNPRFFQESMWRNRSRISGMEKRAFIHEQYGIQDENDKDADSRSGSSGSGSSFSAVSYEDDLYEHEPKDMFFHNRSPFGAYFPLEFFDNEDFDTRMPEDWMGVRYNSQGSDLYPLPGKAFIPIVSEKPSNDLVSFSELTSEVLLDKTPRLHNFRKWLIRERYKRIVQDDPDSYSHGHGILDSESRISLLALTGTTIKTLIKRAPDAKTVANVNARTTIELNDFMTPSMLRFFNDEFAGEYYADSYSVASLGDESDDFLAQFTKADEEDRGNSGLDAKRSESILPDIWSDPNSLGDLFGGDGDVKSSEDVEEEEDDSERKLNENLRIIGSAGDIGFTSPDVDPFDEGGHKEFVFDYNKMKKVHKYNWRWTDVAIFDYNFSTKQYLVRSIFEPIIFAWVPKIYLCMDAEDPNWHAKRIKDAVQRRNNFENILRYNLYIDCLPLDNAPSIQNSMMASIERKLLSTPRFAPDEKDLSLVKKEVNLDYQRTHVNIGFDRITESHHRQYRTWVYEEDYYHHESEVGNDWQALDNRMKEVQTSVFGFKKYRVELRSVIYISEPYIAFSKVVLASYEARFQPYILNRQEKPLPLEMYVHRQMEQMKEVQHHMKHNWVDFIVKTIRFHLEKTPHSWYNLEEEDWDVFQVSKISKYLRLVRFVMQDTLRYMVLESMEAFIGEIRELTESCAGLDRSYEWTNDLRTTEFPPPFGMNPIWLLELGFAPAGPIYTHYLSEFPGALTGVLKKCIESAFGVPDVLPKLMRNLLFGKPITLGSISEDETQVVQFKAELLALMKRALLPVDVYAQKYKHYMPVWSLDIEAFMAEWDSVDHTSKEIRATVEFHVKHYNEMDAEIPNSIEIGSFKINVDPARTELLEKKKRLYTSILDSFATKLRKLILNILQEYDEIEQKLSYRSDDIEEVMELKHYLAGVQGLITRKDELLQNAMKDYELFERFKYRISDEDFSTKWLAVMGLKKMYKLADDAVTWLEDDYERLLRAQQADLSELSDNVDAVSLSVAGLAANINMDKANEAKTKVDQVWKNIVEVQEQSALLSKRQILFGLPPVQKEAVGRLAQDIQPYKSLWYTCAEWLSMKKDAYNLPISDLDMPAITKIITSGPKTMKKCFKYFGQAGEDNIQHIAKEVHHQIDDFKRLVPLIKTFMNPGLRQRHLDSVSEICGFPVIVDTNQSLQEIIDQGIAPFVQEISQVGENAMNELNIEIGLDRMEFATTGYSMELDKDEGTGVRTVNLPKKIEKFVLTLIKVTEDYDKSPYRGPFEERLSIWNRKIRSTYDTIKRIKPIEERWIKFQLSFKETDPVALKSFATMRRIWRRITRIIASTPQAFLCGSDITLTSGLTQLDEKMAQFESDETAI